MNRFLLVFISIFCFTCTVLAQKKAISQARTYIKSGKDLDKAERMMAELLKKDSANLKNDKIWLTWFDAVRKQYEQGNEKLYLKEKYDTASLFTTTRKMFLILQGLDSIDAQPDKKGVVDLKYRSRHADYLASHRPNIFNGGTFFINKGDFSTAYQYFDMYLCADDQPIFSGYHFMEKDTMMPNAAYWATYCGYRLQKPDLALKYAGLAAKDSTRLELLNQYEAEIYKMLNDSINYERKLRDGFFRSPSSSFFFPRLTDYYNATGQTDSVIAIVDYALSTDSVNQLFRFAKSTVLLNTGKYKECIDICNQLITENDSLPDAHYNIGLAYFNQAIELDKVNQRTRQKRRQIHAFYEKALPYLERYRQLAPGEKEKWVPVLYTIYLNLNMGKEFDEIDHIRMKMKK